MHISSFHFYSYGCVVEDIKENTHYVNVYPIEEIPNIDGVLLTPNREVVKNKNTDDGSESVVINKDIKIRAKWLPYGNYNRLTAPSVCKGEMVILFKYGNSENLFWIPLYMELNLRKKERVTYIYSNKPEIDEEFDVNKYYYINVDTVDKIVRLHTANNDGEVTTYDIEINGKEGNFVLTDGKDNNITLSSTSDTLHITTNKEVIVNSKKVTSNTDTIVNNISKNKIENIGDKYDIKLTKFNVSNGSDGVLPLISEFIDAVLSIKHIGNLGVPTAIEGSSKSKLEAIKSRLDAFI